MTAGDSEIVFDEPRIPASPASPLKILVADDHAVVREGLAIAIGRQSDMHVIAEAENGHEAVAKTLAQLPDLSLLDVRMPLMDGIEAARCILEKRPAARVILLSSYETPEEIYRAMEVGAQGYILKEAPMEEIFDSIRAVARGGIWISGKVGAHLAKRVSDQELTPREREVLRELSAGKSNKEIGAAFDISEATVKVHVTHILNKLKVAGRSEAINVAVKRGLVRLG